LKSLFEARGYAMNRPLEAITVPLWEDEHGGLRVGNSRVLLEMVLHAHQRGESPADIVRMYSTLNAADVFAVLAWALRHPDAADAYLRRRDDEAAEVRRMLETAGMTPPPGFRKILEERKARQGRNDAAPGR
jgi:uncharacterized protein (DUF433 family)